jgi:hypothetical protein
MSLKTQTFCGRLVSELAQTGRGNDCETRLSGSQKISHRISSKNKRY